MPNISEHHELDLSAIDIRTIPPGEWGSLKREVFRRAQAERSKAMREFLALFRSWWRAHGQRGERLPA